MIITFADINKIRTGDRLVFGDTVGKVCKAIKYSGGYKCCGMSLPYILENYENVEWIRYES